MAADLSPKEAALKMLKKANDDATFDEIMYELNILQKIERGLQDVRERNTIPHNQVQEEFKKWLQ